MEVRRFAAVVAAVCFGLISESECQIVKEQRQLLAQSKETTAADFIRLVVMRLIFGLASAMGYGEGLSNVLGGIFVPPGADYEDDYDFVPDLF